MSPIFGLTLDIFRRLTPQLLAHALCGRSLIIISCFILSGFGAVAHADNPDWNCAPTHMGMITTCTNTKTGQIINCANVGSAAGRCVEPGTDNIVPNPQG